MKITVFALAFCAGILAHGVASAETIRDVENGLANFHLKGCTGSSIRPQKVEVLTEADTSPYAVKVFGMSSVRVTAVYQCQADDRPTGVVEIHVVSKNPDIKTMKSSDVITGQKKYSSFNQMKLDRAPFNDFTAAVKHACMCK
ncbi:MAG TPA: hypothetical protein VK654_06560 [Nitrospirota bacterium]|nr:hypothetical protein [Nitrospirota bacterium]